jgi:predicted nucleic acid-binding protein
MTALVFVDTNVLLYTYDDRDKSKQSRAREWVTWCWKANTGRISSQVLNELYNNAITKFRSSVTVHQARTEVRRLRLWQPPHLDTYTVDGAWDLQDRFALSYWDALILSSAHQQGCSHLLSEDLQHGQLLDAVRVINPFLVRPDELPAE